MTAPRNADIISPDTYVEGVPLKRLAELRLAGAVAWVDEPPVDHWPAGTGFWAVLRHAEVEHVLRHPQIFSSGAGLTQVYDAPEPVRVALRRMMINMDPPEHSRLRSLVTKAFTPRAVARLEARITARARQLVAAAADRPEVDFAREVAADLPLTTLAEVLGVPESDRWLMFDWSNRVIGLLDAEYAVSDAFDVTGATPMARRALAVRPQPDANGRMPDSRRPNGMADLYAYARELAAYRRTEPGEDIMSLLVQQADTEDGRITVAEFEQLFWLFSVAGNETVRNALPGALLTLIEHPEVYAKLRADRSLLPGAVEELLRWWTPVIQFRRTAVRDTELDGTSIRAGEKVVVFFSSANRDDRVFADPDTFDITRSPNPHLSFGHGPHFCVAAHLARVQVRTMVEAVLDRFATIESAGPPVRLRSNFQNGIKHLPIRWRSDVVR